MPLPQSPTVEKGLRRWPIRFNGDGKLDLAEVNNTDKTVAILTGNGDGTFNLLPASQLPVRVRRASQRPTSTATVRLDLAGSEFNR